MCKSYIYSKLWPHTNKFILPFPFSVYISLSYDFMKKEVMLIKGIVEIH